MKYDLSIGVHEIEGKQIEVIESPLAFCTIIREGHDVECMFYLYGKGCSKFECMSWWRKTKDSVIFITPSIK